MISVTNQLKLARYALPFACSVALSCAPDSSVGSDSVTGGANGQASGAAGAAVMSGGGAPTSGGATGADASGSTSLETAGAVATSGSAGLGAGGTASAGTGSSGAAGSAMAGSGMTGSAGSGGPSLCPIAGAALCDGFENAAPGMTGSDFTISAGSGTNSMAVDSTKAYRGSKSIKFSATLSALLVTKKPFTGSTKETNNNHWGRYFILSGVTAASTYSQSHIVFGRLADNSNQFHFVGGTRGKLQAEIRLASDVYTDSSSMPAATDPSYPLAADGWQCWEWHIQPDDSYSFYINGTEVDEMKITAGKAVKSKGTFSPLPVFSTLSIGWLAFAAGSAISGWIDEVAVGPERIGCGG